MRVVAVGVTSAADANASAVLSAADSALRSRSHAPLKVMRPAAWYKSTRRHRSRRAACEQMTSASNILLAGSNRNCESYGRRTSTRPRIARRRAGSVGRRDRQRTNRSGPIAADQSRRGLPEGRRPARGSVSDAAASASRLLSRMSLPCASKPSPFTPATTSTCPLRGVVIAADSSLHDLRARSGRNVPRAGYLYSRYANPNRASPESRLAKPRRSGAAAAAFASGLAATMTLIQALGPGSHIIVPGRCAYFGTIKLARDVFGPWGVELSTVDMTDLSNDREARCGRTRSSCGSRRRRIRCCASPISKAIAKIAHRGGAICAVDNTWGTPVLQRPLDLGADVSMHSTTKYLGGHSDVLSGALVMRENGELYQRVNAIQMTGGAVLLCPSNAGSRCAAFARSPCACNAQSANAMGLAEFPRGAPARRSGALSRARRRTRRTRRRASADERLRRHALGASPASAPESDRESPTASSSSRRPRASAVRKV